MDALEVSETRLDALKRIVGEKHVLAQEPPDSPFLKDWSGDYVSTPLCVVLPASTQEVSDIMIYCRRAGLNVVPQGGNSGLVGGCHASDSRKSVLLNLRRLNRIRNLDAPDYTVEVEAGCIIQNVQAAAEAEQRLFPLSFGAQGSAQIGGAIATNAGGLNVLRYGMTRDLVLGLEAVLPDGRVYNGLTHLRKDNRGPDLKQLFIGSEGTFGIVTAATLKLFPFPRHRETALLALGSIHDVVALYNLARTYCADLLSAFELIPRRCLELALEHQPALRDPLSMPYPVYVLMDVTASGPLDLRGLVEGLLGQALDQGLVLDGAMADSVAQAKAMWAIREAMVEAQVAQGRHLRTDISVPVSEVPSFICDAEKTLTAVAPDWEPIAYGHVGDGNVHLNVLPPEGLGDDAVRDGIPRLLQAVYAVVDRFHGSISAEHGIGRARKTEHDTRLDATTLALANQLKHLIDPKDMMNRGCIFSPRPSADD